MDKRRKLDVMELKCVRGICEVPRMERLSKKEVRCRLGLRKSMSERLDRKILK